MDMDEPHDAWIFGYGSLLWKQNFPFAERRTCAIEGFARKFYQGSTDHRGVPGKPGRVVTLLPASGSVGGVAFRISAGDVDGVLSALDFRERGGYDRIEVPATCAGGARIKCLCYIANEQNDEYLGPASVSQIAAQVVASSGPSGPNSEYVLSLADELERLGINDEHVSAVAAEVRRMLP